MFFANNLGYSNLTPQTAVFDFINELDNGIPILQNHILLNFKLYVCHSKGRGFLNFDNLLIEITKSKRIEEKNAFVSNEKTIQFNENGKYQT